MFPPKPEVPTGPLNGPCTGPGPAHTSSARAAATGRHAYSELHFADYASIKTTVCRCVKFPWYTTLLH